MKKIFTSLLLVTSLVAIDENSSCLEKFDYLKELEEDKMYEKVQDYIFFNRIWLGTDKSRDETIRLLKLELKNCK